MAPSPSTRRQSDDDVGCGGSTVRYADRMRDGQPYDLGPYVPPTPHYALLERVLDWCRPPGIALEFGVGRGESTRIIADRMPVIGFDSFEGLPEDWRPGFPKGSFAQEEPPTEIENTQLRIGLFEDIDPRTLHGIRSVGLLHIDCDLYSSTRTALQLAMDEIYRTPPNRWHGLIIVFDEWFGYYGCEKFEQQAWRDFVEDGPQEHISWSVLGHSHQAWSIRID